MTTPSDDEPDYACPPLNITGHYTVANAEAVEQLRQQLATVKERAERFDQANTPFEDAEPEIEIYQPEGELFYGYRVLGAETAPFKTWREAYRAAEGYWVFAKERERAEKAEQQLATERAARERAEGELARYRLGIEPVDDECTGGKILDVFKDGTYRIETRGGSVKRVEMFRHKTEMEANNRLAAAEARLAKVGEVMRKTAYTLRNDSGWMSRNMEEFAWKLLAELEAALKGE